MRRIFHAAAIVAMALVAQPGLSQTNPKAEKSDKREVPKPTPATTPAPAPAPVNSDPQSTTAAYGDWVVRCQRIGQGAASQRVCEAAETIQAQGAQQGPIAQIAIGRVAAADPLKLTVVLPPNVSFPSAPRMAVDDKDPQPVDLAWRRCLPGGCFADIEIKDDVLQRWRALSSAGVIIFKDGAGRALNLPFSFRGLAQALDALAKT